MLECVCSQVLCTIKLQLLREPFEAFLQARGSDLDLISKTLSCWKRVFWYSTFSPPCVPPELFLKTHTCLRRTQFPAYPEACSLPRIVVLRRYPSLIRSGLALQPWLNYTSLIKTAVTPCLQVFGRPRRPSHACRPLGQPLSVLLRHQGCWHTLQQRPTVQSW